MHVNNVAFLSLDFAYPSVVAEVITLRRMQTFMEPVLEPMIRKVVSY